MGAWVPLPFDIEHRLALGGTHTHLGRGPRYRVAASEAPVRDDAGTETHGDKYILRFYRSDDVERSLGMKVLTAAAVISDRSSCLNMHHVRQPLFILLTINHLP